MRSSSLRSSAKLALPVALSFAVAVDYLDHATRAPKTSDSAAAGPSQDIIAIPHSKQYFDAKGFPSKVMVSTSNKIKTPMALAATGMRRKNFYIAEVDVYQVGMYVSNESLKASQKWNRTDKSTPLVDTLIVPVKSLKTKPEYPKVMMSLKFVRDVKNDKISDAFNETFSGEIINHVTLYIFFPPSLENLPSIYLPLFIHLYKYHHLSSS